MSVESSPTIVRCAGNVEKYLIATNILGLYSSVVVAAQYNSASTEFKGLDKATLISALRSVVREETALRVSIIADIRASSKWAFVPCHVDDATLERLMTFKPEMCWNPNDSSGMARLIEEELVVFDDTKDLTLPLWRLIVCGDNTVLFIYNHGIGDGKSGITFHVKLLDALNTPRAEDSSAPLIHSLLPPVEKCMDLRVSLCTIVKELWYCFTPASWTKLRKAWTGNFVNPIPRATTSSKEDTEKTDAHLGYKIQPHLDFIELSAVEARQFLTACRSNDTTITSALYALAVSSLSRAAVAEGISKKGRCSYERLSTLVACSMRPHSGIPELAFANHVSLWVNHPKIQPEFRWIDVQAYSGKLKKAMKCGGKITQHIGALKFLFGHYEVYNKSLLGRKRLTTMALSNVGRFPDCAAGEATEKGKEVSWKIGRTLFSQADVISGPAFILSVIGHGTGGLTICMAWGEDTLEQNVARHVVLEIKEGLNVIIQGESLLHKYA